VTLKTSFFITDELSYKPVWVKCNQLVRAHEGIEFTHGPMTVYVDGKETPDPTGLMWLWNHPGQGLDALLDLRYREGRKPIKTDRTEHDEYCNDDGDCTGQYHDPAHYIEVTFDTPYSGNGPNGEGCAELHARYIVTLGQWLDGLKIGWAWENEFTGELHTGYDALGEFARQGGSASNWFRNTVLPKIVSGELL
jgi:hypothetical protein